MLNKRWCLALDLKDDPALIAEYEHYHKDELIWPEIIQGNKACGIISMDIYRAGNRLFMIMETADDFNIAAAFAELAKLPRQKEWSTLMLKFQQSLPFAKEGEHWVLMDHIFKQS